MEISGYCLPPHCRCRGHCCPAAAPRGYQAPASPGLQRVGGGNGQSRANPGGHGLCWAMENKRTRPGDGAGTGGRGQRALQDPNTPHLLRFTNDPPSVDQPPIGSPLSETSILFAFNTHLYICWDQLGLQPQASHTRAPGIAMPAVPHTDY